MAGKAHAQHGRRRSVGGRAMLVGLGVAGVAAGALATLAFTRRSSGAHPSTNATSTTVVKAPGVSLYLQPPDAASQVRLDAIVRVLAAHGHLNAVQVLASNGAALAGSLDSAGLAWTSSGPLAAHTTYSVDVSATGESGRAVDQVSHFQTLTPRASLGITLFPSDGLTVGVGSPLVLRFDHPVVNQSAMLSLLKVTESTPVAGGWHWFSNRELHFRPQQYWPAKEQVSLTANLAGFDVGNGVWATANHSVHFAIGDAHVSVANVQTHQMTVTSNGRAVATYPISAGRTVYPTMNGVHIAVYRQQDVHMVSSTVGIPVGSADGYDEHVFWDVNISDGGEFVHAAPWSTGAQGSSNVSHGCVNLSVPNAIAFFNFSRAGDIVEVIGSPRAPSLSDHGTMDWTLPWDQWSPAS